MEQKERVGSRRRKRARKEEEGEKERGEGVLIALDLQGREGGWMGGDARLC